MKKSVTISATHITNDITAAAVAITAPSNSTAPTISYSSITSGCR